MLDSSYDEDLSDNLFFQEFKTEYKHLINKATTDGWIICVPKAGSFEKACLREDDFYYHILIPTEEHSCAHYQTLNGKKVRVSNKVITIEDDAIPSLDTPILFEETFYTENLSKYEVWCVECLLNQNYIQTRFSSNSFNLVLSLRDCIDFLSTESLGKQILESLDFAINNFLMKHTDFYKTSLQEQKDLVSSLYTECLHIALEDSKLFENAIKNKQILNNLHVSVEAYMQHNIHKILFSSICVHLSHDDSAFNKIIRNLSDIQLRDLDIVSDVYDVIPCAKYQLAKINCFSTVLGKIGCLRHTVSEISQTKSQSTLSVDDLLPVFVFLILKTCVPNWIANLCFLKQFQFSYLSTGDEANFLITTLEAAIEFIRGGISTTNPTSCEMNPHKAFNLFEQVRLGNYEEVKIILENNCLRGPDLKSRELCHPLCSCDKCERLLSQISASDNATVHSCDERGCTALHYACMYGKPKIVALLLEYKADIHRSDYSGATALHYAALKGHQNALLLLLHSGASVNATDSEKNNPLHFCCNNGHETCVKALLYFSENQTDALDVNSCNLAGETALHHAAKWGYKSIVELLLEYGADPTVQNKFKKTACDYAHNLEIYQTLIKAKCKCKEFDDEKLALENEVKLDLVEESYEFERAVKPFSPAQMKKAELLLRAVVYDDTPMICYYLGLPLPYVRGKSEEKTEQYLCHPLCVCDKCQHIESTNTEKQDINICNSEGYTALHVAALHGRLDTVKLLLSNGASPNVVTNKGLTVLHLACKTQRPSIVELLLKCSDIKAQVPDREGNTPLHYAFTSRDFVIIKMLVRHGVDMDVLKRTRPLDKDDVKFFDLIEEYMKVEFIHQLKQLERLFKN